MIQENKNKIFIRTLINNACIDPKPKKSLNRGNMILKLKKRIRCWT